MNELTTTNQPVTGELLDAPSLPEIVYPRREPVKQLTVEELQARYGPMHPVTRHERMHRDGLTFQVAK